MKRQLTISRAFHVHGCARSWQILIDGNEVGKIGAGGTQSFTVSDEGHTVTVVPPKMIGGSWKGSTEVRVAAGPNACKLEFIFRAKMASNELFCQATYFDAGGNPMPTAPMGS